MIIVTVFYHSVLILIISRVLVGLACGFNNTTAPRMLLECFPTSKRWIGGIYTIAVSLGVLISFCIGKLAGNENLKDLWYLFLFAPCIVSFFRMLLIITVFGFETPAYNYGLINQYGIQEESNNQNFGDEISNLTEKADKILSKFNKNSNDIYYEKQ